MRTWHKVLLVTVVLGLPTVVLGQMIWPSPSDGPEPTSGQLGLFVGLSFFDALAWGLGIAWLLFALPRLRRIAGGSEVRAWAMYLSIGWALVSWWPHSNMHRSNGDDLWGLLLIDYLFHPTLMLSALVLGWSLLTLPAAAGAAGTRPPPRPSRAGMPASPDTGGAGAYPRTINNGAGERLTFVRRVRGPDGESLEVENLVKPGTGPPMHVHHYQEEALTVRQGRIGHQRPGEPPRYAGPGETVVFKPGETHRFWNAGEEDLVCAGYVRPPDNIEYFLTELYRSRRENGGRRPDLFDAAFLAWRYRSEFRMAEIPALVQRLVFPAQVAVGRLLGRYGKYADAPEPVRR